MPHTDPTLVLAHIADIARGQDGLAEWLETPDAVAGLAALVNAPSSTSVAASSALAAEGLVSPITQLGTSGNDTLSTAGSVIRIFAGAGDDMVMAGTGANSVLLGGGTGNDTLLGGSASDFLFGGAGSDRIDAGAGDDIIIASPGNDLINGGTGNDTLVLGNWDQPATITLADANSVENVLGGNAADTIHGGAVTNILFGGGGNDVINGGSGNDILDGGAGADRLTGGPGADTFRFQTSRNDTVTDFHAAEGDRLQLAGTAADYTVAQSPDGLVIFDASANPVVTLSGIASLAAVTLDFTP